MVLLAADVDPRDADPVREAAAAARPGRRGSGDSTDGLTGRLTGTSTAGRDDKRVEAC